MLLVGLTGGLATGKSSIAALFQRFGAKVIDADILAREVVTPNRAAWKDIVQTFGKGVLNPDRTLNRAALASRVFQNPRLLQKLNGLVHPRVAREQAKITRQLAEEDPGAVILYDAALLIEARAHRRMDRVIVVTADKKTQLSRAVQRGGMTRQQALSRIRGQIPLAQKLRYADYVIDGTVPLKQLQPIVQDLYRKFRQQAQHPNRTNTSSH